MTPKLLRLLSILGLAALVVLPVRADDDDDLYDDEDDSEYVEGGGLTDAQEAALELAEKNAELAAKAAEKSAKLVAAAADRAARRSSAVIRAAVKAQGNYNIELAKLTKEQGYLDAVESLAIEAGVDLSGLPSLEEILTRFQEEAQAEASFYRSLIPLSSTDRASALAARALERAADRAEIEAFLDTLSEFQAEVVEATAELAEELADVADAYLEWQDKLALSQLSSVDFAAERARRAAAERARKAELSALPRAVQPWLRKAWSAEEDVAEFTAALARLQN